MKHFDFAIGNPPYQEPTEATRDKPVYDVFMDEAFVIADKVELITPGRFLFNAGATPKPWNEKMLHDEHFKVLSYEPDATKVFSNVGFKGGVAITYRDASKKYGAIETYSIYPELNKIRSRVSLLFNESFSSIMFGQGTYKFTSKMHQDHPEVKYKEGPDGDNLGILSKGHDNDIATNALEKLDGIIMFANKPNDGNDYIQILGLKNNVRTRMYIRKDYVNNHQNLNKYKVAYPKANGAGILGETFSDAELVEPGIGHTQTFLSIGCFDDRIEAENTIKYLKTKFCRTLLSVLKVTQDNPPEKWKYIPLQDFSSSSDINWLKSIKEIDQQLYRKYGLVDEEIQFIETHVKEME